jgi:hypothetical protein
MDFSQIAQIFTANNYKVSILLGILLLTQLVRTQGSKIWPKLGTGLAAWCVAIAFGVAASVVPKVSLVGGPGLGDIGNIVMLILVGAQDGLITAGLVRGAQKVSDAIKKPAEPSV